MIAREQKEIWGLPSLSSTNDEVLHFATIATNSDVDDRNNHSLFFFVIAQNAIVFRDMYFQCPVYQCAE